MPFTLMNFRKRLNQGGIDIYSKPNSNPDNNSTPQNRKFLYNIGK